MPTGIAVIGAGPAGIGAALSAAECGIAVTLIDEHPLPGGQYLRAAGQQGAGKSRLGSQLTAAFSRLSDLGVQVESETLVWGVEEGRLALHGPGGSRQLQTAAVVLAPGARERLLPFPGWTLPGVMTPGAGELLSRQGGIPPGTRVVLGGSGPLLLAAADALLEAGAEVLAVFETGAPWRALAHPTALLGNLDRLQEGWRYLRRLQAAAIPYRPRHTVLQAIGETELRQAVFAPLDRHGYPDSERQLTFDCDALLVAYGFSANIELPQLLGCRLLYAAQFGGWIVAVDQQMATSLPGVFAAGEITGIAGAQNAWIQGRLAGLQAARHAGAPAAGPLAARLAALRRRLPAQRRFSKLLHQVFAPPSQAADWIDDQTIVCRCELVRGGEIRKAIRGGAATISALKNQVAVAQGPCQGRGCGETAGRMIAAVNGSTLEAAGLNRPRPPLKPVPLAALQSGGER